MTAMYTCPVCAFSSDSLEAFAGHYRFHKSVANFDFPCPVTNCTRTFCKYLSFRSHIHRDHEQFRKDVRVVTKCKISSALVCQVPLCCFQCKDLHQFLGHLRHHIQDNVEVVCPFKDCAKSFSVKSSFSSHLSRIHRDWSASCISNAVCSSVSINDHISGQAAAANFIAGSKEEVALDSDNFDGPEETNCAASDTVDEESYLRTISLFYLKLQAKLLLPASTIQQIIEEFQEIHDIGLSHLFGKLQDKLAIYNIPESDVKNLLTELSREDLLHACNSGVLRSDQTRKTFFKTQFHYVEPVQMYLGQDGTGTQRYFQYVPIKNTLEAFFKHDSVKDQYRLTRANIPTDGVFEDLCDGKAFLSNQLFREFPSSLRVILYQDSFEVVNPLGSGKRKHKILAVYLSLADLLPHCRSSIDQMQLVLLCREEDFKTFGHKAVFSRMLEDFQDLERNGVDIGDSTVVKGTVCVIVGDNLGSHCIGGFAENFSTTNYFCRYCRQNRQGFGSIPYSRGPARNPQSYDQAAQANEAEGQAFGVKFSSVFNELQYFHVCQPGLPPCLGHDLFEGVVSKDVALYIKHFVKVDKYFTYVQLNRIINQFKYLGSDADNKPCDVNLNAEKLGGHAVQNWCFLRLLPLLIGDRIEDPLNNQVWQLCLQLRNIVDLICAPRISVGQVADLRILTEEYLHDRKELFPNDPLKPKHHYVAHYPELILQFGPLIRLWTLRFESKHTYFKQCARKLHNFKNLCHTLAVRHQLLQAYYSAGFLFPNPVTVHQGIEFDPDTYNCHIQQAVETCQLECRHTVAASSVVYKGTTYKKGLFVVLEKTEEGLVFGKIQLILVCTGTVVYFITETHQSLYLVELGCHCLISDNQDEKKIVCIEADKLLDYYPLAEYRSTGLSLVSLHHAIC